MLIDRVISCLSINRTTSGVCVTRMYRRVLFEVLKVRVRRVIHSHNKHIHNKRIRKPTRRSQVRRGYDPSSSVCLLLSFSCRQHQIVIHMRTTARNRTICFVWTDEIDVSTVAFVLLRPLRSQDPPTCRHDFSRITTVLHLWRVWDFPLDLSQCVQLQR